MSASTAAPASSCSSTSAGADTANRARGAGTCSQTRAMTAASWGPGEPATARTSASAGPVATGQPAPGERGLDSEPHVRGAGHGHDEHVRALGGDPEQERGQVHRSAPSRHA